MVFEAAFVEQRVIHEEMPAIDRSPRCREGGAGDDALRAEARGERFTHRADIALGCGIKGRAILEQDLPAALREQPFERRQRLRHGIRRQNGPALQRDDPRLAIRGSRTLGHAKELHGLQPAFPRDTLREGVGAVACTREIIRNHTQKHSSILQKNYR